MTLYVLIATSFYSKGENCNRSEPVLSSEEWEDYRGPEPQVGDIITREGVKHRVTARHIDADRGGLLALNCDVVKERAA